MTDREDDIGGEVILGYVGGQAATFAMVDPAFRAAPTRIGRLDAAQFSTFTGALQEYARQHDIGLRRHRLALAVAGAIKGDTVRVTNGRWILSVAGLTQMLGAAPIVINDVSAIAWATLGVEAASLRPLDPSIRTAKSGGRRMVIWLGEGLGAATLGFDDGGIPFVLDGEAGHMTFAAETDWEKTCRGDLARHHGHVSYERILTLDGDHAAWRDGQGAMAKDRIALARAGMLGSFAGNATLAAGAWNGVYFVGPGAAFLSDPQNAAAMLIRLRGKGRYQRILSDVPCFLVSGTELGLTGVAKCAAARLGARLPDRA